MPTSSTHTDGQVFIRACNGKVARILFYELNMVVAAQLFDEIDIAIR